MLSRQKLILKSRLYFLLRLLLLYPVPSYKLQSVSFLFLRNAAVPLYCVNIILKSDCPVGAIRSEVVDLTLNPANIILNRLAQLSVPVQP